MKNIIKAVDKHRDMILEAERYIWKNPETGYREVNTSRYMQEKFEEFGYEVTLAGDIPGFYAVIDTQKPGPEILVLGELDSLICPNHPESDKETGYVHACGHNVQCATLLGIAAALKEDGVLDGLSGRIRLCTVPAEELVEIGYRTELKNKGIIKYFSGKSEFLHRGYFDGVDIAFMVHSSRAFAVIDGAVGCVAKTAYYKGFSAHAGGAPWEGRNALYAATQGLSAANAIRESFKEEDIIRFHPIITHGGEVVNAIPELVAIESYVRGKTFDAIKHANRRINQALIGAALSVDTNIEILDMPGYSPLINNTDLIKLTKEAADLVIPEEEFEISHTFSSGSTDMGDLSCVMPVVHPYSAGVTGKSHGEDYMVADPERACIKSAKMQLVMLKLLLKDDAKRAKEVIKNYKPLFNSKEEFFEYVDGLNSSGDRIKYCDDKADVKLN